MPAGVGYEPTTCRIASQAFTAPRPEIARPLSHGPVGIMIKPIARTLDLSRCTEHAVAQTPLVRLAAESLQIETM